MYSFSIKKSIIFTQLFKDYHATTSNNINMLGDLKTDAFER